jgi:cytochrome c553
MTSSWVVATLAALLAAPPAWGAGDAAAGRTKARQCAVCHGLDGIARNPDAPNNAGASAMYLTRQLVAFRDGVRINEQMSVIAPTLTDQDIADLAAWYASIRVQATMPN